MDGFPWQKEGKMDPFVFSIVLGFFIKKVQTRYGEETAREIRTQAKNEYKEIIPHMPKVGGFKN